jgi:tRNA A-37 threonylcarbamoyl transferase component Bud32/membrane-associated phospholipid phosphatase
VTDERLSLDAIELGERAARSLDQIGERRTLNIAGVRVSGRRRRPSGERPPLPRELQASGRFWLGAGIVMILVWGSLFAFPATTDWWTEVDMKALNWLVDLRNDTLDTIAKALHALGSVWLIRPLRWGMILGLLAFKRFRALFGVLGSILIVGATAELLADAVARPRPLVDIIGGWVGYAHPSRPVAALAVTVTLIGLAAIPRGPWRRRWFLVSVGLVVALGLARMYLGVDHPSDVWTSAFLGPSVAVVVMRLFVPEAVFPVTYRRGVSAHLDVGGPRGEAIRTALREQLGFEAHEVEHFGLEGSGGSTPLRIRVAGDPDQYVFAKVYARSHLRADRWYKAGRTILYGSLEDEVRFQSVRRLVEYEDYMLLLLSRAGLPSPKPYGFIEITPEREYMIVTEFIEGAKEMGESDVTDDTIDDALMVVRRMWDTGLAHRDIKPANVLVRDGRIVLIDPAFSTVRPSPWRQAVDLANMMLILALRSSPERVYERALRFFAPEDIAEAFASSAGITIPSQSRHALADRKRREGLDIIARFRELAPPRERITIQRWSARRIGLAVGAALLLLMLVSLIVENLSGRGFI